MTGSKVDGAGACCTARLLFICRMIITEESLQRSGYGGGTWGGGGGGGGAVGGREEGSGGGMVYMSSVWPLLGQRSITNVIHTLHFTAHHTPGTFMAW